MDFTLGLFAAKSQQDSKSQCIRVARVEGLNEKGD